MLIHNTHIHTFLNKHVPNRMLFIPGLIRMITDTSFGRFLIKFIRKIYPLSDSDLLDRLANYTQTGGLPSQCVVFKETERHYPAGSRFIILSMDFEYMGAGNVRDDYKFENQLEELACLKKQFPKTIFPFICVDPRRNDIVDYTISKLDKYNFSGIKLYPPLGYYPFDPRLDRLYEYAQENNIPIISHASTCAPLVHYRGSKKKLLRLLNDKENDAALPEGKSKRDLCAHFTHPENYRILLEKYSNLKLCFAHAGGKEYWDDYLSDPPYHIDPDNGVMNIENTKEKNWLTLIIELIGDPRYPNLYMDISSTLSESRFLPLLKSFLNSKNKRIREKILFGSDFYMNKIGSSEKKFSLDIRYYIGEEDYCQIAEINPSRFLGLPAVY